MTIEEAREVIGKYRKYEKEGIKMTIGYGNIPKIIQAFDVMEAAILDLSTCERPRGVK